MDGNARHWGLVLDTHDSELKVDGRRVCFPKASGRTRARQIATASRLKKTGRPDRDRPGAWGEPNLYTYQRNKGEKTSALHIAEQKQGLIHMHATRRRQLKAVPVGPSRQERILAGLFLHRAETSLTSGSFVARGPSHSDYCPRGSTPPYWTPSKWGKMGEASREAGTLCIRYIGFRSNEKCILLGCH